MKLNRRDLRLAKKTLRKVNKLKKKDPNYRISKQDFNIIRKGGLSVNNR